MGIPSKGSMPKICRMKLNVIRIGDVKPIFQLEGIPLRS
jgi:hypothetical protein